MITKKIKGELIEFYTKDNLQLHGFLTSKNHKNVIIYLHGMGGNFYRNMSLKMSNIFINNGFDIFSINTRGHDEIAKFIIKKGKKLDRAYYGTSLEKFEDSKHDIRVAIDLLIYLGYKNVILVGHSTGCQKAVYYLNKYNDKRIKALVLLGPGDDYNIHKKDLKNEFKKLQKEAKNLIREKKGSNILFGLYKKTGVIWSAQRFDSIANSNRVESRIFNYNEKLKEFRRIKAPILVIWGDKDEYAVLDVRKYIKISRENTSSKKFNAIIIKNANHSFTNHEIETANKIVSWLRGLRWQ